MEIFGKEVPIEAFSDSKKVFDVIEKDWKMS